MKYIIFIIMLVSCFVASGQTPLPTGNPVQFNTGRQKWGYQQSDSATIIAVRDTAWLPRFAGSVILWQNAGVDTAYWYYNGSRWLQLLQTGDVPDNAFVQDGNSFADTATLGTNDNFPLIFETNGIKRVFVTRDGIKIASGNDGLGAGGISLIGTDAAPNTIYIGDGFLMGMASGGTGAGVNRIAFTGNTPVAGAYTSGVATFLGLFSEFEPTSGDATYTSLYIRDTINQTGGANGITRGLHIDDVLTSATDYRAIEISTDGGYGIYQPESTASNYLAGDSLFLPNLLFSRNMYSGEVVQDRTTGLIGFRNQLVDTFVSNQYAMTWEALPTPANLVWGNFTWSPELRMLVAVSHSASLTNIMTSQDGGLSWTLRTTPNTNALRGVAWSPTAKIFAAVASTGTGNRVTTSTDGITWTAQSSPADYVWRNIKWIDDLGLFIAVANTSNVTNKVMTSPDGINWTLRTCPDRPWSDIAWSPELQLLCVSATGLTTGGKMMTSPDGINWTLRTTPGDSASWEGITWSGDLGLFIAVSYSCPSCNVNRGKNVMTSPDGINWTLQNTPASPYRDPWQNMLSVDWSPEFGMAAAVIDDDSAGYTVMTSTNATNWTLQQLPTIRDMRRIKWIKELSAFIAVAYYDGTTAADSLIFIGRPLDDRQNYVSIYGRSTDQSIKGNIYLRGTLKLGTVPDGTLGDSILVINNTVTKKILPSINGFISAGSNITITGTGTLASPYVVNSSGSGGTGFGIDSTVIGGTAGSILFVGTGPVLSQDNTNLFWDNSNKRLGIKDNTPSHPLDVAGIIGVNGLRGLYIPSGMADNGTAIAIGEGALGSHTTGVRNVAIGLNALNAITTGFDNVAIGSRALDIAAATTNSNVAVGTNAGGGVTSGSGNLFLGNSAGNNVTSGSNNIIIGASASAPSATGSSQLSIGNSIYGTSLGASVAIGIATTGPDRRLDVLHNTDPQLRLTHTDGSVYTDFQTDGSGFMNITPTGRYIATPTGSTSAQGYLPNVIFTNSTTATSSGTTETDLHTFTTPASSLSADGESIEFVVHGIVGDNTGTKTIRAYWAGTEVLEAASTSIVAVAYELRVTVTRSSSTNAKVFAQVSGGGFTLTTGFTSVTTTFTNTNILKCTGQSDDGGSTIDAQESIMHWRPAKTAGGS